MPAAHASRRARLATLLAAAELPRLLVTDLVDVRYLTGFTGSAAALLVDADAPEDSVLCTDDRYALQAADQVPDLPVVVDRGYDLALLAGSSGRVGFQAQAVTVARHAQQRAVEGPAELVATEGLVEQLRAVKDDGEIEALARACAIADAALAGLMADGGLAAGRSEREIGLDLDERMRRGGASGPAFSSIIAAGEHSAIPHHEPTDRPLQRGDLLKLDFGALVDGYHSDMTRTLVLGPPADWQRELHALVRRAQQAGREAATVGATGAAVDAAARSVIEAAGHGEHFGHGLGHGVGLRIHEAPALDRRSAAIMADGMCVTVEPGVYLPGRGGVRIEDTGVIRGPGSGRGPGYQVLTLTSTDLLEL